MRALPPRDVPVAVEDCRLALLWHLAGTAGWLAGVGPARLVGRERALVEAAVGDGRLVETL